MTRAKSTHSGAHAHTCRVPQHPKATGVAQPGTSSSFASNASVNFSIGAVAAGAEAGAGTSSLGYDAYLRRAISGWRTSARRRRGPRRAQGRARSRATCGSSTVPRRAGLGVTGSVVAAPQQAAQLQLAPEDILNGGGGEYDGEEGAEEEWKDRSRSKRRFKRKGGSVGGAEAGDHIV